MIGIPEWIGSDAPTGAMRRACVYAEGERIVYEFETNAGDLAVGDKRSMSLPHAGRLMVFEAEVVGLRRMDAEATASWRAVV